MGQGPPRREARQRVPGVAARLPAIGFVLLGAARRHASRKGSATSTRLWDRALVGPRPAGRPRRLIGDDLHDGAALLFTRPARVGTAIYLEEYANRERWYNRLIEINIQNLAAVPSIVYGILGLAFLVRGLGLGRVLLAGALILTLLVLPTVIIASREAIRAVPDSIRQGRIRARRHAVAGRLAPGAARGHPGHRDRRRSSPCRARSARRRRSS